MDNRPTFAMASWTSQWDDGRLHRIETEVSRMKNSSAANNQKDAVEKFDQQLKNLKSAIKRGGKNMESLLQGVKEGGFEIQQFLGNQATPLKQGGVTAYPNATDFKDDITNLTLNDFDGNVPAKNKLERLNSVDGKHDNSSEAFGGYGNTSNAMFRSIRAHPGQDSFGRADQNQFQTRNGDTSGVSGFVTKQEVECLEAQVAQLEQELAKSTEDKRILLDRVSQLMGKKLSEDETDLENINDKHRPSKVQEVYKMLMTEEWLRAKQALEKVMKNQEEQQILVLHDILWESFKVMKTYKNQVFANIHRTITYPFRLEHTSATSTKPGVRQVPKTSTSSNPPDLHEQGGQGFPRDLHIALLAQLKQRCDQLDYTEAARRVFDSKHYDSIKRMPQAASRYKAVETYAIATVSLAWKMLHQTPEMSFRDPGNKYRPEYCNLHMKSKDPAKYSCIRTVFFPCLYHGEKLVEKAVVMCG